MMEQHLLQGQHIQVLSWKFLLMRLSLKRLKSVKMEILRFFLIWNKRHAQVISIRSIEGGEILVSEETMIVAPKVIELAQATPVDTQTDTQSVEADVSESEDQPQKTNDAASEENPSTDLPADPVQVLDSDTEDNRDEVASTDATQNDLALKTPQLPQPTQEDLDEEVQQI